MTTRKWWNWNFIKINLSPFVIISYFNCECVSYPQPQSQPQPISATAPHKNESVCVWIDVFNQDEIADNIEYCVSTADEWAGSGGRGNKASVPQNNKIQRKTNQLFSSRANAKIVEVWKSLPSTNLLLHYRSIKNNMIKLRFGLFWLGAGWVVLLFRFAFSCRRFCFGARYFYSRSFSSRISPIAGCI